MGHDLLGSGSGSGSSSSSSSIARVIGLLVA